VFEKELVEELKSLTILYVEDEPDVQNALASIIRRRSGNLILAANGQEGYEKYLEFTPDLIITDIKMPIMDGLEMSRKIREHSRSVPIVITTAFNDTSFLIDAIDTGINQFVLKPIDSEKLFAAIMHCVREITYEARLEKSNVELTKNLKMLTEYKNAVEASSIVSITNPEGKIIEVNEEFCAITGYRRDELIGQTHKIIKINDNDYNQSGSIKASKAKKEIFKGLVKNRKKNGENFYVNLTIVPILDQKHEVVEYVELRNNVTKLIEQIFTDPLTGFPNRTALSRDVILMANPVLLTINLDSFKDINDFYGNASGDMILIEVTSLLDGFVKTVPNAKLYKLSSDEFAVLTDAKESDGCHLPEELNNLIEKHEFDINGTKVNLSATIGYSFTQENIIANADMALKYAKSHRIDSIGFEDVSFVEKEHENNIIWSKKLKEAIFDDKLVPYFQPIVDNTTGKIVKYEALIRMLDADEVISPFKFLDIAIKAKLYPKLTRIMIDKVFDAFKDKPYSFSINFTASDVLNEETKGHLIEKIQTCGFADRFIVEILESEGFERYDEIKTFFSEVKALGCKVAIDDFGSGYSNFQHLINLNVDFIKIDGSLIKNLVTDTGSQIVTQTIANFAKKLGAKTIAEFVHNEAVQNIVLDMGIDFSQGYYFGEPQPLIHKS
jgi:PAS domain S-box-containing protein/diguanylate cyclase (GGDEF)-like protein